MLKINNVPVTDKLLKIYLLKLHQIGFLRCLDFRRDIFDSLICSKSFDEINSNELFTCCPLAFADFIPEFLYFLGDDMIELATTVFDFPVLYTSIEKLGDSPFYEAKYGLFPQTGCDLFNIEGSLLRSIHPESLFVEDNDVFAGFYRINVDADERILIIDEFMINRSNHRKDIYRIDDVRLVNIVELNDIPVIINAIKKYGFELEYASEKFRDNKEVVLAAVLTNGHSLRFASENLRDNKEVVLAAVLTHGSSLRFASDELRDNKEVVLAAVLTHGSSLRFASDELRDNKEVVLAAVSTDGSSLRHASDELRNNKEVVLAAVSTDGSSLRHASDELRDNKVVVIAAVKNFGPALSYASISIQQDEDVQYVSIEYFKNKIEILNDLEAMGLRYRHNGDEEDDDFWDDLRRQDNVLKNEIISLCSLGNSILKDNRCFIQRIFVVVANCVGPDIIFCIASDRLLESKEFFFEILVSSRVELDSLIGFTWSKLPSSFWLDGDCVLATLMKDFCGDSFKYASEDLKSDREFVLKAVNINGSVLEYASPELKADKEVVLVAVKNNERACKYASGGLQSDKEISDLIEEEDEELPF